MSDDVLRVKERADIVDVISSYIDLSSAGKNLKGICPFHNEKSPSFFVSPDRQTYYCFGCGAKGDVINFIEQYESLDFLGSLKMLAERVGVELTHERGKPKDDFSRLFETLEAATVFFEQKFKENPEAQTYMQGRGFGPEICEAWRIGFAPDEWRSVYDYLKSKQFSDDEIAKAGLSRESQKGGRVMDLFRNRVMFPIRDISGRVIAFSGRTLSHEEQVPKYVNSPETELFKKSVTLYGLYEGRQYIRKRGYAILVEGQMDVLACHSKGLTHTVASSGTAFTVEQARVLKRIAPRIIVLFDSDNAGKKSALRTADIALSIGMEVKIALLPEGMDPADVALHESELLKQKLVEAKHAIEVATWMILDDESKPERRVVRVTHEVVPLILRLESESLVDHFTGTVARMLDISKESLAKDIRMSADKNQASTSFTHDKDTQTVHAMDETDEPEISNRLSHILRYIVALQKWKDVPEYQKRIEEIMDMLDEEEREELYRNIEVEKTMFEVERLYEGASEKELEHVMDDFLKNLHIEVLRKKYERATEGKTKFLIRKEIDILKGN